LYFFNLFAKFQHLYLKPCNMGDMLKSQKALLYNSKRLYCPTFSFSFGYLAHYTLTIWKGIKICKTSPFGFHTYRSTLKRIYVL